MEQTLPVASGNPRLNPASFTHHPPALNLHFIKDKVQAADAKEVELRKPAEETLAAWTLVNLRGILSHQQ